MPPHPRLVRHQPQPDPSELQPWHCLQAPWEEKEKREALGPNGWCFCPWMQLAPNTVAARPWTNGSANVHGTNCTTSIGAGWTRSHTSNTPKLWTSVPCGSLDRLPEAYPGRSARYSKERKFPGQNAGRAIPSLGGLPKGLGQTPPTGPAKDPFERGVRA